MRSMKVGKELRDMWGEREKVKGERVRARGELLYEPGGRGLKCARIFPPSGEGTGKKKGSKGGGVSTSDSKGTAGRSHSSSLIAGFFKGGARGLTGGQREVLQHR